MDNRVLLILEVSQKQNYIFSSKKLRDNAARSEEIARVTGSGYFKHVAGDLYSEEENMVSTGGGHTVLQFGSAEQAKAFAARVTERVLRDYNGLELFAKQMPYDEGKSPGENLKALTEALEKKKSVRQSGFRLLNFGVEKPDSVTFRPKPLRVAPPPRYEDEEEEKDRVVPPEGWKFPVDFDDVCGDDNFLAVIHIDGNSMGKRVGAIYDRAGQDWESCCASLRRFSDGITADFHGAFQEMLDEIAWPARPGCPCVP